MSSPIAVPRSPSDPGERQLDVACSRMLTLATLHRDATILREPLQRWFRAWLGVTSPEGEVFSRPFADPTPLSDDELEGACLAWWWWSDHQRGSSLIESTQAWRQATHLERERVRGHARQSLKVWQRVFADGVPEGNPWVDDPAGLWAAAGRALAGQEWALAFWMAQGRARAFSFYDVGCELLVVFPPASLGMCQPAIAKGYVTTAEIKAALGRSLEVLETTLSHHARGPVRLRLELAVATV